MRVTRKVSLEGLALELSMIPQNFTEASDLALRLPRMLCFAKAVCPVETGALRDSIRVIHPTPFTAKLVAGGGGFINPKTGRVVDYAGRVHDGTSRMPPRPFLAQAVQSEKRSVGRGLLLAAAGVR